jgi:septation ring formation regulator EzrA
MNAVQLKFNINNESNEDFRFSSMQKQIDDMNESMGKIRRKLFSQMGDLKKICEVLRKENEKLKNVIKEMKNEKFEWTYEKDYCLFDVQENQG